MSKRLGIWGKSLSIRLDAECVDLGWKQGDKIHVVVQDGKIVLEKVVTELSIINGVRFVVKEG